jgi:hypothetical protein
MKIYKRLAIQILIFTFITLSISCSNSPESVYKRMLDKYENGKNGNITLMAEKFLQAFSLFQVNNDDIFFNKSLILSIQGNHIKIVLPEKINLKGDKSISENIMFADINNDNIMLGNNKGFCVFDKDGDPHTVFKTEKKDKIDAIALKNKNVVYLSQGKIFEMSPGDKKVKRMDSGEYHSPYKKYFRSSLITSEKYIALATGIAGSYYISVFDGINGLSIVKNIAASSSELNINGNSLSYVKGGTGNWSVEKYEIPSKKRNHVKGVGKIDNIFIAKDGFITLSGKKYSIENFSGEKGIMPHEWNIIGTCRNTVLIEYGKIVYVIDFSLLLHKIKDFNAKTGGKMS